MPHTPAHRAIGALRSSHDNLVAVVDKLGPDALERPSYCDGWDIAGVLSHLGSGAEVMSKGFDAIRNGGDPDPSINQEIWDRWNAKSPAEQTADSLAADTALVERWESLDDEQLAGFTAHVFGMQLDAAAFAGLRLAEHILHTWDIEVMDDPGAELPSEAAAVVADRLPNFAGYFGKADRRMGAPFRWVVQTSDTSQRFLLGVDERVQLTEEGPAEEDGEVVLPVEAFVRLVYGRLDPDHTPGGVELKGPADLDELRRVFPGV